MGIASSNDNSSKLNKSQSSDDKWLNISANDLNNPEILVKECSKLLNIVKNESPLPSLPELTREQLRLRHLYLNQVKLINQYRNDLKSIKECKIPTVFSFKDRYNQLDEGKFTIDDLVDSLSLQDNNVLKIKSYLESYLYLDTNESSTYLFHRLRTRAIVRLHKAVSRQSLLIQAQIGNVDKLNDSLEDLQIEDILQSKYGWKIFYDDKVRSIQSKVSSIEVLIASSLTMNVANLSAILSINESSKYLILYDFLQSLIDIYNFSFNSSMFSVSSNISKKKLIEGNDVEEVIIAFDRNISYDGSYLEFSKNNRTVVAKEIADGSQPAAMCEIKNPSGSFSIQITNPTSNNLSFTFGIAKKDISHSSSSGFGKESNSWGIIVSSNEALCYGNGSKLTSLSGINQGDLISLVYNISDCWADLYINCKVMTRFNLIKNIIYFVGVTLEDDMKATILPFSLKNLILFNENISNIPNCWSLLKCQKGHSIIPTRTVPQSYSGSSTNPDATIICDICSMKKVNLFHLPYYHCSDNCNWDCCFACSLPADNDKPIIYLDKSKTTTKNAADKLADTDSIDINIISNVSSPVWLSIERLIDLLRNKCLNFKEVVDIDNQLTVSKELLFNNPFQMYSSYHKADPYKELEIKKKSISNLSLSFMFQLSLFRGSLQGVLEVIHHLIATDNLNISREIQPSFRFLLRFDNSMSEAEINKFFISYSNKMQACVIMKLLADFSKNIESSNNLFMLSSVIEFDYLLNLINNTLGNNSNLIINVDDNDIMTSIYALKIIYYNIEYSIRNLSTKEKNNFLNVPMKSIKYYEIIGSGLEPSSTCLDKLNYTLKLILGNINIDPETNPLGEYAVKIASLRDVMYPNSSIQFKSICQLLSKNENKVESPCEKYLISMMMKDLEGKSMLELIHSSDYISNQKLENININTTNDNFDFICSLLSILKKIFISRWTDLSSTIDLDSFMFQSINKVLETLVMQYVSYHINIYTIHQNNQESMYSFIIYEIIELTKQLMIVTNDILQPLLQTINSINLELSSNIVMNIDNLISRSFIGSLLPIVIAAIVLFLKDCSNTLANIDLQVFMDFAKNEISRLSVNLSEYEILRNNCFSKSNVASDHLKNLSHQLNDNSADLASYAVITSWEANISDTALTYTDNNLSCRRPGSASCYPAAFALVPNQFAIFNVVLSETSSTTNWLSIGLGKRNFPVSNSDGFGRSSNSWGIADDRSKDSENSFFAYNGTKVQSAPRKLKLNDIITLIVNLEIGSLEISINYGEFSHVFGPENSKANAKLLSSGSKGELAKPTVSLHRPLGSPTDFVFGATFANDHKLTIETPTPDMKISPSILYTTKQIESWTYRIKYDIHEYECLLVNNYFNTKLSKEIVDLDILKSLNRKLFLHRISETEKASAAYNLLHELTDAPNGLGKGNILVTIMKKYVLQDRGMESRSNHLVHAVCAALLWHCNQYENCLEIVNSENINEKPNKIVLDCWRYAQNMRSLKQNMKTNDKFDFDEDIDNPLAMLKQYSLPIPDDSSFKPLDKFSLDAVRRARFLLEFTPYLSSTSITYSEFLAISKDIVDFILEGPNVDAIRFECSRRDKLSKDRCDGLNYAVSIIDKLDVNDHILYHLILKTVISCRDSYCKEYYNKLTDYEYHVHYKVGLNGSSLLSNIEISTAFNNLNNAVLNRLILFVNNILVESTSEPLLTAALISFNYFTFNYAIDDILMLSQSGFMDLLVKCTAVRVPIIRYIIYCIIENIVNISSDFIINCKGNEKDECIDDLIMKYDSVDYKYFESIISTLFPCLTSKILTASHLYSNKLQYGINRSLVVNEFSKNITPIFIDKLIVDRNETGLKIPLKVFDDNSLTDDIDGSFALCFNLFRFGVGYDGLIFSIGNPIVKKQHSFTNSNKEDSQCDVTGWSNISVELTCNGFLEISIDSSLVSPEQDTESSSCKQLHLKSFSPVQLSKWSNISIIVNNKLKSIMLYIDMNIDSIVSYTDHMSKILLNNRNVFHNKNVYLGQQVEFLNLSNKNKNISGFCIIENLYLYSSKFDIEKLNYLFSKNALDFYDNNNLTFFNSKLFVKNSYVTLRPSKNNSRSISIIFNKVQEGTIDQLSLGYFITYSHQSVNDWISLIKTESAKDNSSNFDINDAIIFGKTLGTYGIFHKDFKLCSTTSNKTDRQSNLLINSNDRAVICFDFDSNTSKISLYNNLNDKYYEIVCNLPIQSNKKVDNDKSELFQYFHVGVSIGMNCSATLLNPIESFSIVENINETTSINDLVSDHIINTWDTPSHDVDLDISVENGTVFNSQSSSVLNPISSTCTCTLSSPRSSVSIIILSCVLMGDFLSFGIFKKDDFSNESIGNGFGKSANTIGISNMRTEGSADPCEVCAFNNLSKLQDCPQLIEGDIISMAIDFTKSPGLFVIKVNSKQFLFKIPIESPHDYLKFMFGITVSLQHELAIVPDNAILNDIKLNENEIVAKPITVLQTDHNQLCFNWDICMSLSTTDSEYTSISANSCSDLLRCYGIIKRYIGKYKFTIRSAFTDISELLENIYTTTSDLAFHSSYLTLRILYTELLTAISLYIRSDFNLPSVIDLEIHLDNIPTKYQSIYYYICLIGISMNPFSNHYFNIQKSILFGVRSDVLSYQLKLIICNYLSNDKFYELFQEIVNYIFTVSSHTEVKFHVDVVLGCYYLYFDHFDGLSFYPNMKIIYQGESGVISNCVILKPFNIDDQGVVEDGVVLLNNSILIDKQEEQNKKQYNDKLEVAFSNNLSVSNDNNLIAKAFIQNVIAIFDFLNSILILDSIDSRSIDFSSVQSKPEPVRKVLTFESPHPYADNTDEMIDISIPGAKELVIIFDPRSRTEQSYDYVRFYKDSTKVGQWGQDKYSGNEFPGMNGTDPLRIPSDSCVLCFHSDGSNNDWGYLVEVTGVISGKGDVPIRPLDIDLAQLRLLQLLGIKLQSSLIPEYSNYNDSSSYHVLWSKEYLSRLLKNFTSYQIVNVLETSTIPNIYLKNKLCDYISISHEKYTRKNCFLSFQLHQSLCNEYLIKMNTKLADSGYSEKIFDLLSTNSKLNYNSNDNNDLNFSYNYKTIKSQLTYQLSQAQSPGFHLPKEKISIDNTKYNDSDKSVKSFVENGIPFKLKCSGVTTHCRIRAGPSLQTGKVGDFPNGSVVLMSGRVHEFLRLADGRGFVISYIEGGIKWEKCHQLEDTSFIVSNVDIQDLEYKLQQSSALYLHYLRESIRDEIYLLLCHILSNWPKNIKFDVDDNMMILLLRVAGISKLNLKSNFKKGNKKNKKNDNESDFFGNALDNSLLFKSIKSILFRQIDSSVSNDDITNSLSKITIDSFTFPVIESLNNKISNDKSLIDNISQQLSAEMFEEPKYLIFESKHQYENNENSLIKVHIPNVKGLEFVFDEECSTERNYDYVAVYADEKKSRMVGGKYSGRKTGENNWPGVNENPSLILRDRNTCWINFITDGTNVDWGWKVTVYPYAGEENNDEELQFSTIKEKADFEITLKSFSTTDKVFSYVPSNIIESIKFCDTSISMGIQLFELITHRDDSFQKVLKSNNGFELLHKFCQCVHIISSNNPNIIIKYMRSYISILYSFHFQLINNDPMISDRLQIEVLLKSTNEMIINLANDAFSNNEQTSNKKVVIYNILKLALGQAAVAASYCSNFTYILNNTKSNNSVDYSNLFLANDLQITAQGRGLVRSKGFTSSNSFALGPVYPDIFISSVKSSNAKANIELNDKISVNLPYSHTHFVKIFDDSKLKSKKGSLSSNVSFTIGLLLISPTSHKDNSNFDDFDNVKIDFTLVNEELSSNMSRLSMHSEDNRKSESWMPKLFRRGFIISNSKETFTDIEMSNNFSSLNNGDIIGITVIVDEKKKWSVSFTRNNIVIYTIFGKDSIDKLFNIKQENKSKLLDQCCLSMFVSFPNDFCDYQVLFLNPNEELSAISSKLMSYGNDCSTVKKILKTGDIAIISDLMTVNENFSIYLNESSATTSHVLFPVTENCCLTIELSTYPDEDLSFSIGFCQGEVTSYFGNFEESHGLYHSKSDLDNCKLLSNKNQLSTFRRLKASDILCIAYNRSIGKGLIYCNNNCIQEFTIHLPGSNINIYIGLMLYQNCVVKVLETPEPIQQVSFSPLTISDSPKSSRSSETRLSVSSNDSESSRIPLNSDTNVSNDPVYVISQWNTSLSQNDLEFFNNNMSVKRPGGISCYPAAIVKVPEECSNCKFSVVIDEAPIANNTLSWGIAQSSFPTSGHKAFGEMEGSWGLLNNRLENNDTKIYGNGQLIETFRRLREGDVLTIVYKRISTNTQTAELTINQSEYSYIFNLPLTITDWLMGSTLCNDHVLTVQISNPIGDSSSAPIKDNYSIKVKQNEESKPLVKNSRKITSLIDEFSSGSFLNYMSKRQEFYFTECNKLTLINNDYESLVSTYYKKQFSKSANYLMESLFIDNQLDSLHQTLQPLGKVNGLLRYLIDDDISGLKRLPHNNCSTIIPTVNLIKKLPIRSIISQIQFIPFDELLDNNFRVDVSGAIGYAYKLIYANDSADVANVNNDNDVYRISVTSNLVNNSNNYFTIHDEVILKCQGISNNEYNQIKSKQHTEKMYNDFETIYERVLSHNSPFIPTNSANTITGYQVGDIVIRKAFKPQQFTNNSVSFLGELGDVIEVTYNAIVVYWRSAISTEKYYLTEIDIYINLYQSMDNSHNFYLFTPFLTRSFEMNISKVHIDTNKPSNNLNKYLVVIPLISLDNLIRSPTYSEIRNKIFLPFTKFLAGADINADNKDIMKPSKLPSNFDKIIEISKYNVRRIDRALVAYIDDLAKEKSWNESTILSKTWEDIAPSSINGFSKFPILLAVCSENMTDQIPGNLDYLKYRYVLIMFLNYEIKKCFDLIDFEDIDNNVNRNNKQIYFMSELLLKGRSVILHTFKHSYIQKILTKSESSASKFELVISRSRSLKYKSKGEIDDEGKWSVFGQTFRQLNSLPVASLRRSGQVWQTVFAGERAQDAGGPYREVWSAMTEDLLSNYLLLLLPSPNAVDNTGIRSEAYIINPDCVLKKIHVDMLVFLGKLMGIAIRTNNYMDITLAPIVWKLIINDTITFDDVRLIDLYTVTNIENLRSRKGISEDDFLEKFEGFYFTIKNLSGREVDLIANGKNIQLVWNNIDEYCDLVEEFRKNEMRDACNAIRSGIVTQIPPICLTLYTWEQIEENVCGQPSIDLTLLKSITEYSGCHEADQHIVWFWDILENIFSHEDRKAFIRFAWGRTRLPLNKAGFSNNLKIQNLSSTPPDIYLPESHTCFFTVDLPRYSSKEIMIKKLTYAVHHCTAIDGDGTSSSMRAGEMLWED